MTDDEFLGLAYGELFGVYEDESDLFGIDAEHARLDEPAVTARLKRTCPSYTETMTISGYPSVSLISVVCPEVRRADGVLMPGTTTELPVGWRDMASAEKFRSRFEQVVGSYERMGWKRA